VEPRAAARGVPSHGPRGPVLGPRPRSPVGGGRWSGIESGRGSGEWRRRRLLAAGF
jgi:hypothetical protein